MKAFRVLGSTLVASNNCFDVQGEDHAYRIVNFFLEDIEALPIEWPIEIKVIGPRTAVVHDPRIPDRYYRNRWCTTCCPEELLPIPQRLEWERQEMRGQRVRHDTGSVSTYLGKEPQMEYVRLRLGERHE